MEFIHKGTVNLETDRLILRKWQMSDAADLYEYAKNPEMSKYIGFEPHANLQASEELLSKWTVYEDKIYKWAIVYKANNKVIGDIVLVDLDEKHNKCEIGYSVSQDYWGQGIMSEAVNRVIKFLFEDLKLHRVCAKCAPENIGSRRVMEKCGMTYEGIARESYLCYGKYQDSQMFSILEHEFKKGS